MPFHAHLLNAVNEKWRSIRKNKEMELEVTGATAHMNEDHMQNNIGPT